MARLEASLTFLSTTVLDAAASSSSSPALTASVTLGSAASLPTLVAAVSSRSANVRPTSAQAVGSTGSISAYLIPFGATNN